MLLHAFNLPARMTPVTDDQRRETTHLLEALRNPACSDTDGIHLLSAHTKVVTGAPTVAALDRALDLALSVLHLPDLPEVAQVVGMDLFLQAWARHPGISEDHKRTTLRQLARREGSPESRTLRDPFILGRLARMVAGDATLQPATRSTALGLAQKLMSALPTLIPQLVDSVLQGLCHPDPALHLQAQATAQQMLSLKPSAWSRFQSFFKMSDMMHDLPPDRRRGEQLAIGAALGSGTVPVQPLEPLILAGLGDPDRGVQDMAANNVAQARETDPQSALRFDRFATTYATVQSPDARAMAQKLKYSC